MGCREVPALRILQVLGVPISAMKAPLRQQMSVDLVLRRFIGATLAIAAVAKLQAIEPGDVKCRTLLLVCVELGLAASLMVGAFRGWGNWCGAWLFAGFTVYTTQRILTGHRQCGCFGNQEVPIIAVWLFDLLALAYFGQAIVGRPRKRIVLAACLLAAAFACASLTYSGSTGMLWNQNTVVLRPDDWQDDAFPLNHYLPEDSCLERGVWILGMVNPSCEKCQSTIERLDELAENGLGQEYSLGIIGVSGDLSGINVHPTIHTFRLPTSIKWICPVPRVVTLADGRVIDTKEGFE